MFGFRIVERVPPHLRDLNSLAPGFQEVRPARLRPRTPRPVIVPIDIDIDPDTVSEYYHYHRRTRHRSGGFGCAIFRGAPPETRNDRSHTVEEVYYHCPHGPMEIPAPAVAPERCPRCVRGAHVMPENYYYDPNFGVHVQEVRPDSGLHENNEMSAGGNGAGAGGSSIARQGPMYYDPRFGRNIVERRPGWH